MCGIVGAITKNPNLPIKKICDTMSYRGPDDEGTFSTKSGDFFIYLGHRRLSIIDLTTAGKQPMSDMTGMTWIIYNGEIYNFKELRERLEKKGYVFKSRTDTEVIIAAYNEWGIDCLQKFNGMFAFGIWDQKKQQLFLARDLAGQKPLYWASLPGKGIIFASEIKAILKSKLVNPEVNTDALPGYLAFLRVHAPQTMFKNIYKLESGSYLLWQGGEIKQGVWWEPVQTKNHNSRLKINELENRLEYLLIESIKRHMISDVPVGAFLSGGLDSSLIVALASRFTEKPLKTFTIGFSKEDLKKEGSRKNELIFARQIRDILGSKIDYNEIILKPNILELLPKVAWHIDEPICDPAAINAYLICKAAREGGAKVLLSGMGGDEVFAGYNHYLAGWYIRYFDKFWPVSKLFLNLVKSLASLFPNFENSTLYPYIRYLKRKGKFLDQNPGFRYIGMSSWLMPEEVATILSPDLKFEYQKFWWSKLRHFQKFPEKDLLWRMMYTDFKTFLADHNLAYTDRMSMAVSCEVRAPLLDRELVEFMYQLPPEFKIRNFKTKYLLKKTAEKLLPKEIIYQKKSGFAVPIRAWFSELKPLMDDLLSPKMIEKDGYFNSQAVEKMIKRTIEGKQDFSYQIWALLMFKLWKENFVKEVH
jgi:asparagine synthase (glutamine-hydrolysing)